MAPLPFIFCYSFLLHIANSIQLPFVDGPCEVSGHSVLDDPRRSPQVSADVKLCDSHLAPAWYRMKINGTSARIPTSCPAEGRCGTTSPVWLAMAEAPPPGEEFVTSACIPWVYQGQPRRCCVVTFPVAVRNCGDFLIYHLQPTSTCPMAYCAESDRKSRPPIPRIEPGLRCHVNPSLGYEPVDVTWMKLPGRQVLKVQQWTLESPPLDSTVVCKVRMRDGAILHEVESSPLHLGITATPPAVELRPGVPAHVELQVPVSLDPCPSCDYPPALRLQTPEDSGILLSTCELDLSCTPGCSPLQFTIHPWGARDPLTIQTSLEGVDAPWDGYDPPNIQVVLPPIPGSYCYSFTDPHYITLDSRLYRYRGAGTFVLYKALNRKFEVQTRVWEIPEGSANCGVAAVEGNTLVILDMCQDQGLEVDVSDLDSQPRLRLLESHNMMTVQFLSGTRLTVFIEPWGLSVALAAGPWDFGQTRGLCGTFDADPDNDIHDPQGQPLSNLREFFQAWRVSPGDSFFDRLPHKLQRQSATSAYCDCHHDTCFDHLPMRPFPKLFSYVDITHIYVDRTVLQDEPARHRRSTFRGDMPLDGDHFSKSYAFAGDDLPLPDEDILDLNNNSFKSLCNETLRNSAIAKSCGDFLASILPLAQEICEVDTTTKKNARWAVFAIPLLKMACEAAMTNANQEPTDDIKAAFNCPNGCSHHGVCTGWTCICHDKYSGDDCSINEEPKIGLDYNDGHVIFCPWPCHNVTVAGWGMLPGSTRCRVNGSLLNPVYISDSQITCELPGIPETSITPLAVEVVDIGKDFSKELHVLVFNPSCHKCIGDFCYTRDDICTPENTQGCFSEGPVGECGWCDPAKDPYTLLPNPVKGAPIVMVPPANMTAFPGEAFLYQLVDLDGLSTFRLTQDISGAVLSPDGLLEWNATTRATFRVEAEGECNLVTSFSFVVDVVQCECKNGGSCQRDFDDDLTELGDIICKCPPPFQGGKCELWDPCEMSHCHPGVACVSECGDTCPECRYCKARCGDCPEGLEGNGTICTEINGCFSNPCYPGVKCTSLKGGLWTCGLCPNGSVGDGQHCLEVDGCLSNPCYPGVKCTSLKGGLWTCGLCPNGSVGDGQHCLEVNGCLLEPCYPGVECRRLGNTWTCDSCPSGLTGDGTFCQEVDGCAGSPCHPGVRCYTNYGRWHCGHCPVGTTGDGVTCRELNPCDNNPCYPGVECHPTEKSWTCGTCPAGLVGNGEVCQKVAGCNGHSCYPGVPCVEVGTSRKCGSCPTGYTGDGVHCMALGPCGSNPCYHGVSCTELSPFVWRCGPCPPGLVGDGIQCRESSDCLHISCYSGVPCVQTVGGRWNCGPCPGGMVGDGVTCDYPDGCASSPCYPGVLCTSQSRGQYTCGQCPPGMRGNGVDCSEVHRCPDLSVCYPGVECLLVLGQPVCGDCPPGTSGDGTTCVEPDACQSSPCHPGVPCYSNHGRWTCGKCPRHLVGDGITCKESQPCRRLDCHPGVECLSSPRGLLCGPCPPGTTGDGHTCIVSTCPEPSPCYPGVGCTVSPRGATCGDCPPGLVGDGRVCRAPVSRHRCVPPCRNGGWCIASGICRCPRGFTGPSCRRPCRGFRCRQRPLDLKSSKKDF